MSLPSYKLFLADKLLRNKPDALCDKPINSVASQPNNSVFVFYIQRLLTYLLIIYSVFICKASSCKPLRR